MKGEESKNIDEDEGDIEPMTDEEIDFIAKNLLKTRRNGQFLPLEIIGHLEFFYNTLVASHNTENPFSNPSSYPALLFQDQGPTTLLENLRRINFPSDATSSFGDS